MIVFIDFFTKWTEIYPAPNHTRERVIHFLVDEWIKHNGCPAVIHTDNGPELVSYMIRNCYKMNGIKQVLSTAYHSQSLGVVERVNGLNLL